ncbi:pyridoxamine 5'-phosphate oxidase family protein [Fodinicola feengrottensis]|nr:pyridoxamine 5'-phosphate oxidase family protein [Fodinicola feengrottensis]
MLRTERNGWLATADSAGGPHLVPLAYVWDGSQIVMSTKEAARTVRNGGRARLALGSPTDVVLIDGDLCVLPATANVTPEAVRLPLHPSRVPGCVYLVLKPRRVLAWRDRSEMRERVVMASGHWLI